MESPVFWKKLWQAPEMGTESEKSRIIMKSVLF
jgi:hypothetical protein